MNGYRSNLHGEWMNGSLVVDNKYISIMTTGSGHYW